MGVLADVAFALRENPGLNWPLWIVDFFTGCLLAAYAVNKDDDGDDGDDVGVFRVGGGGGGGLLLVLSFMSLVKTRSLWLSNTVK